MSPTGASGTAAPGEPHPTGQEASPPPAFPSGDGHRRSPEMSWSRSTCWHWSSSTCSTRKPEEENSGVRNSRSGTRRGAPQPRRRGTVARHRGHSSLRQVTCPCTDPATAARARTTTAVGRPMPRRAPQGDARQRFCRQQLRRLVLKPRTKDWFGWEGTSKIMESDPPAPGRATFHRPRLHRRRPAPSQR